MLRIFCGIMIFLTEFELAFTPRWAKNYGALKEDLYRWRKDHHRHTIKSMGIME